MKCLGLKQITNLSAAVDLLTTLDTIDAKLRKTLRFVRVQAEAQNVRWTDDGSTTPTASLGFVLTAGSTLLIDTLGPATKLKFIEVTASAKLNVSFYGTQKDS